MTDIRTLREAMRELTYIHLYYKKKSWNERLSDQTYSVLQSILMTAISEIQSGLSKSQQEINLLKDVLRDVLKAVCSPNNGVEDTIWVGCDPIGDFIMCALNEDIDLDALQNAPYRCKQTLELFKDHAPELLNALEVAEKFMSGFEGDELQDGVDHSLSIVRSAITNARGQS